MSESKIIIENIVNSEMSSRDINFTDEQRAAIKYRDGSLLVSAAAGSGKTKVLVERLLSRIDEQDNIDEFLIITYTRAAAYELRERIYDEILSRLADSPGNNRLRRQAMLCRGASIDTIHTFCAEILRNNAHLVRLPPDFRIADESESFMIMNEVADNVLTAVYADLDKYPGFKDLIDMIVIGRDDKQLVDILLDIYKKLQSTPDPYEWVMMQIQNQHLSKDTDIANTVFGDFMLRRIKDNAEFCYREMLNLQGEMKHYPDFEEKYSDSIESSLIQIKSFLSALEIGWDEAKRYKDIEFPRAKPVKGYDELKEIRARCNKMLKTCAQDLEISSEEHIIDMNLLSPAITALLNLILEFDFVYAEEKQRKSVVDFSDLEHLTLSLLIDRETGEKTDLALNISTQYKEIMVDEYQDVNAVQELIFKAVSRNNDNIFMVGDVKQSIYRFRLADPSIFLNKYSAFPEYKDEISENDSPFGKKIHLSKNFRSNNDVLSVINHVFSGIMSTGFGEMEYTEKEMLISGRNDETEKQGKKGIPYIVENPIKHKNPVKSTEHELLSEGTIQRTCDSLTEKLITCNEDNAVEFDLLDISDVKSDDLEENPDIIQLEAEYVADKIKYLIQSNYMISDKKAGLRPVKYSDITILLRSVKGRAWRFAAALTDKDIPAEFPGDEGFYDEPEISAILLLLSIIDNPMQDIPLAAVLSGPIYKFSSDEMAEIRSEFSEMTYYEAIKGSAEPNTVSPETSLKCKKLLNDLEKFRVVKGDLPADRFIWYIYNETGLPGIVGSLPGGEKRKNNLIILAECAKQFEKSGYKGLFGFLTYINNLQERGINPENNSSGNNSDEASLNTVKIMSIHKSKGLEFPIVFLVNTSKQFNYNDIRKEVVFHKDLGIGTMLIDKKRRIKYSTLARDSIRYKLTDEMISEEVRVLYVALTRACEKLIITAAIKNTENTLLKFNSFPHGKIPAQLMKTLKCMSDWLIVALRNNSSTGIKINHVLVGSKNNEKTGPDEPQIEKDIGSYEQQADNKDNISLIKPYNDYIYPFSEASNLPSKLTVTGIGKDRDHEVDNASWLVDKEAVARVIVPPAFIEGKRKMTASERGTLLHHVMQHINYEKGSDEHLLNKELSKMIDKGIVTQDDREEIDIKKIVNFFNSPIGERMKKAKTIKREFKFSVLRPAELYFRGGGTDKILIQGIIDCYFEEDDELVILDFKSDKINENIINEKIRQYTPQLDEYAEALEKIIEKRVKEKIIYFFDLDLSVNV